MTGPALSVLVCSFNRADLLAGTLESLCAQGLDRADFEIILIDDGSGDHTAEVADAFQSRLPLRYVYQDNAGLAAAKNHAIELAEAPLVLFQDDDDLAHPDLLGEHLKTHQLFPAHNYAVLGHTDLEPAIAADPLMHFTTRILGHMFRYHRLTDGAFLDYSHFWGGRSSCKRSFLEEYGVFNPDLRFNEDVELGYRLAAHDLKVVYNAKAKSTMVRAIDFDGFCNRSRRKGQANALVHALHPTPEIRAWAEMEAAEELWPKLRPLEEAILNSARKLDKQARQRLDCGETLDRLFTALLHRGYQAAFKTSLYKGIAMATEAAPPSA